MRPRARQAQADPHSDAKPSDAVPKSDSSTASPPQSAKPLPAANPKQRQQVGMATALWMSLAIGGIAVLGTLAAWHLSRRGRLIRERLDPPKPIRWPEFDAPAADPAPAPKADAPSNLN